MATFKKQKHSRKNNKNKSSRSSRSRKSRDRKNYTNTNRLQYGGVANACTSGTSMSSMLVSNPNANLHNVNPQMPLDNQLFGGYGTQIPLDNMAGGMPGGYCGDEGVGTNHPKTSTFQQYLNKINTQLELPTGGGTHTSYSNTTASSGPGPNIKRFTAVGMPKKRSRTQKGAGFTTDPSEFVGGMPVYKGYDDCCPPTLTNGSLTFGGPNQPVCGFGAIKGGGRSRKRLNTKKRNKHQQGGDFTSIGQSKPAPFNDAFNGPKSIFAYPDDMKSRDFSGKQPVWSPSTI